MFLENEVFQNEPPERQERLGAQFLASRDIASVEPIHFNKMEHYSKKKPQNIMINEVPVLGEKNFRDSQALKTVQSPGSEARGLRLSNYLSLRDEKKLLETEALRSPANAKIVVIIV